MLEKSFIDLCTQLNGFRLTLRSAEVALAGDEALTGAAQGIVAMLDQVVLLAQRAQKAARLPADIDAARRALPKAQRQFSMLVQQYRASLDSPKVIEQLRAAGRENAIYALSRCNAPIFAADWALSECWRSLAEWAVFNPGGVIPFVPRP
jgi:hypothetical protein